MANWSNFSLTIVMDIAGLLDFDDNSELRNVCRNVCRGVRLACNGFYICVSDTRHGGVVEYPRTLRRWHGIFYQRHLTHSTWYELTRGLEGLDHLQYVRMSLCPGSNHRVFQEYFDEYMENHWSRKVRVRVDFPRYFSLLSVLHFGHATLYQYSCDLRLTYRGFYFTKFMIRWYCLHGHLQFPYD